MQRRRANGTYADAKSARKQARRRAREGLSQEGLDTIILYQTRYGWGFTFVGSAHHAATFSKAPFRDDGDESPILAFTTPETIL